ncbi:MAG: hypothetical protein ACKO1F_03395 [Flammeovirgaceae bacterium]
MAFNWHEYIALSKDLIANRSDESAMRTAVSRAYYGTFGILKPYCTSEFNISSKESRDPKIHQKIIEKLKTSPNRLEFSVGNALSTLRDDRNIADYDSSILITKPKANKSINDSRMILDTLNILLDK